MYPPNPILRRYYKKEYLYGSSIDYTIELRLFIDNGFRITIHATVQPYLASRPSYTVKIAKPNREEIRKNNRGWTSRYIVTATHKDKNFEEVEEILWGVINFNRRGQFEINHTATKYLFYEWFKPSVDWNPWKELRINSS
jgi:hypothetical protein